jgi:hypothetical protein
MDVLCKNTGIERNGIVISGAISLLYSLETVIEQMSDANPIAKDERIPTVR